MVINKKEGTQKWYLSAKTYFYSLTGSIAIIILILTIGDWGNRHRMDLARHLNFIFLVLVGLSALSLLMLCFLGLRNNIKRKNNSAWALAVIIIFLIGIAIMIRQKTQSSTTDYASEKIDCYISKDIQTKASRADCEHFKKLHEEEKQRPKREGTIIIPRGEKQ